MTRKSRLRTAFLLAVVMQCAWAAGASALEVGALFNIGNLAFSQDRAATDTSFSGTSFPWGLSVYGRQALSSSLTVESGFAMDPILRNVLETRLTYSSPYLIIGGGPFLGVFNSSSLPLNPGISASMQIQMPGVAFFSFRGDSTLGAGLVSAGDYTQGRSDLSLGFYVPNAICSFNLLSRRYVAKTSTGDTIDERVEYSFKTDIFEKNRPYRVVLTFGYQQLSKTFIIGSSTTVDALGSLIIGTRVEAHLTKSLVFIGDLQSGVYSFGQDALLGISNPGPFGYLFQLRTGLQLSLGSSGGN